MFHHTSKFIHWLLPNRKEIRIGTVCLVCSEEGYAHFRFYVGVFWSIAGNVAFNLKLSGVSVMTKTTLDVIRH